VESNVQHIRRGEGVGEGDDIELVDGGVRRHLSSESLSEVAKKHVQVGTFVKKTIRVQI
jgi:hypothetical protein